MLEPWGGQEVAMPSHLFHFIILVILNIFVSMSALWEKKEDMRNFATGRRRTITTYHHMEYHENDVILLT